MITMVASTDADAPAPVRGLTLADLTRQPSPPARPVTSLADTGCDWRRYDPRFGSCCTCPLPQCRGDYPLPERQRIGAELKAAAYQAMLEDLARRARTRTPTERRRGLA